MQDTARRKNYTIIQALRGIAAIWVVLFHAREGAHITALENALPPTIAFTVFHAGHFGVAIFFALSGFVISYGLSGATVTPSFFGRFILRRSIRLDPTYWVSIVVAIAFVIASAIAKHEIFTLPGVGVLLAHLFYLQVILQQPEINTAFWTLTYEVQFYLFLVGALVVKTYIGNRVSAHTGRTVDIILFGMAMLSALGMFDDIRPGVFAPLWGCFYVGVLADTAHRDRSCLAGLIILSITLVPNGAFAAISAVTAVFIWACVTIGWATRGLNWRWLQFLGAISYSLYLIHNPVTGAVSFVVKSVVGVGLIGATINLLAILSGSIVAAWILWRSVERGTHRLARAIPAEGPLFSGLRARDMG